MASFLAGADRRTPNRGQLGQSELNRGRAEVTGGLLNTGGKRRPNRKRPQAVRAGYGDVLTFSVRNPDWRIPLLHGRADWVCPHQVGDSFKELIWLVLGFLKEGIGQNAVGDIDATEFSADHNDG